MVAADLALLDSIQAIAPADSRVTVGQRSGEAWWPSSWSPAWVPSARA